MYSLRCTAERTVGTLPPIRTLPERDAYTGRTKEVRTYARTNGPNVSPRENVEGQFRGHHRITKKRKGEASRAREATQEQNTKTDFQTSNDRQHQSLEDAAGTRSQAGDNAGERSRHGARGSRVGTHRYGDHSPASRRRGNTDTTRNIPHTTRGPRVPTLEHRTHRTNDATNGAGQPIRAAGPRTTVATSGFLPAGFLPSAPPGPTGVLPWSAPVSRRGWGTRERTVRGPDYRPNFHRDTIPVWSAPAPRWDWGTRQQAIRGPDFR